MRESRNFELAPRQFNFPLGALAQRKGAAGCRERNDISTSSGVLAYLFKCSCNLTCKVPRKAHAREKGRMGPFQKSASVFIRISLEQIHSVLKLATQNQMRANTKIR
jgi:hypothetical protein